MIDPTALGAAERGGWAELRDLLGSLTPEQRAAPGYFAEGWSAKDLLAHVAGWLAEAVEVLEQVRAGTFQGRDLDIDARNAVFLEANRDVPFALVEVEAEASRHRLLQEVKALGEVSPDAEEWLRKAGPEHYADHLPRLRAWVAELRG